MSRPQIVRSGPLLMEVLARAARDPDPATRNAAVDLIRTGTWEAPPQRTHLSVAEVAELWGVSSKTVRRRITDGTITVQRAGRRILIPLAVARSGPQGPRVDNGGDGGDGVPEARGA